MTRKICVVTGSRAEYGLLRWVMQGIKDEPTLILQVVVTGMHLSPEFGLTYKDIEQDGFYIDRKVEMLISSDTPVGITKSIGLGMIGFAEVFDQIKPDIVVLLGDRFEIFSAATAALIASIPLAHLHGGEVTIGSYDEAIRHSITKMSHLHFVSAEVYKNRVIQLGEDPKNVFLVGGLGVESVMRLNLLSKEELEKSLKFKFGKKNLLITFHPVTLEKCSIKDEISELLNALDDLNDTQLIFTMPNADNGGREISEEIKAFVEKRVHAHAFKSLGYLRYLSCMSYVDAVIGNSSSGLLEAPSLKKATINIGNRQDGRILASSVINCDMNRFAISAAIDKIYSKDFQAALSHTISPFGNGNASKKIVDTLVNCELNNITKKIFNDFIKF